ncbi:MAG: hypothetical protein RAP03_15000 [Candidatus Electryonea clarkiae]|nr:hypothetical protein [Candidatus Electryonea clarkiae]
MKSKLEIYALSVCFAAVVGLVISAGVAGYSVFEIIDPELTMISYTYDKYQTNEAYWKSILSCSKTKDKPNEEELTKKRQEAFVVAVKAEKRGGIQSLIRCLMFILTSGITLLIHWKIAKKSREA